MYFVLANCTHFLPWETYDVSRSVSQISQRTRQYPTMCHFVTEMCTCAHFCYKVVYWGIWDWCIVRFVRMLCREYFSDRFMKGTVLWNDGVVWYSTSFIIKLYGDISISHVCGFTFVCVWNANKTNQKNIRTLNSLLQKVLAYQYHIESD